MPRRQIIEHINQLLGLEVLVGQEAILRDLNELKELFNSPVIDGHDRETLITNRKRIKDYLLRYTESRVYATSLIDEIDRILGEEE